MEIKQKNKKGISLIVLVITIIVMIILAAAIILSLNSSEIIGKANEATSKSDEANLKEAASIKLAEYQLKKQLGELEDSTQTASEYVKEALGNDKMDTAGLAITEEGEILTGLTEIAIKFVEAGVKIGDVVEGYTLDTSDEVKTYTTSGNENTVDPYDGTEADPQSASITRDESITWKYFGIDEKGEATIVGSITSSSPKMTLGGKGGYLNGPSELKEACKAMYSSNMGTGRSITIEDVTRVLEYTEKRGEYLSYETGNYMPLKEPLTIREVISKYGEPELTYKETPNGNDINTYKLNSYGIGKTSDVNEYNTAMADIIYPGSTATNPTLTTSYWLASACLNVDFIQGLADFDVRHVSSLSVSSQLLFCSTGDIQSWSLAVRPVVWLSSDINMSYSNGVVTLSE